MFGDSSINSVGGDAGKLFPDGQTDGQTDGRTDGRRTVTHNPLFSSKNAGIKNVLILIFNVARVFLYYSFGYRSKWLRVLNWM